MEQGEIDHRAIGQAVDAIADGAADDQPQRDGGKEGVGPGHPDRQCDHSDGLHRHQRELGRLTVVLEPAEADADVPGQHQVEERRHAHRAATGEVEHVQQPDL